MTTTIDTMDGVLLIVDADGRIQSFNRACERLSGFTIDELRDRHLWSAFLIPEEVDVVHEAFDRLRRDAGPVKMETYLLTKHGHRRRVSWTLAALRDELERLDAIICSGIDVTLQHLTMSELERAETSGERPGNVLRRLKSQFQEFALDTADAKPLLAAPLQPLGAERRAHRRRAYPYVQVVAPMVGDDLPEPDQYYEVHCHDISASGFSFFTPRLPAYQRLVVAFGSHPARIHLIANVVHVSPKRDETNGMYVVGCRYARRAHYQPAGGETAEPNS